jgi:hypothetical protein
MSLLAVGLAALLIAGVISLGTGGDSANRHNASLGSTPTTAEVPGGGGAPEPPPYFWTDPFGPDAVEVASADDARTAFQPDVPDRLPDPNKIEETDPSQVSLVDRGIAWTYSDSAGSNPYILVEQIFNATQAELEGPAAQKPGCSAPDENGSYECSGSGFSIKEIRGGVRALLSQGPEVTTIEWFEPLKLRQSSDAEKATSDLTHPVLDIRVMGPSKSFTPDEALSVANDV